MTQNKDGRSVVAVKLSKAEIEAKPGAYDDDGFFIMEDKSFYDPLGYYFDEQGYDTVGGRYNSEGFYVHPSQNMHEAAHGEDLEEYTLDDENDDYGEEEDQPQLNDDDFERQAVMHEHIMPAQLHVKNKLEQDRNSTFYVRVLNFPNLYQERTILRFLTKKITGFSHTKLLMERDRNDQFTGSVLIQANEKNTIYQLLLLHDYRLQGHDLQTWLMGFEYDTTSLQMMAAGTGSSVMGADSELSSIQEYENIFNKMQSVQDKRRKKAPPKENPEETKSNQPAQMTKQKSITTQEDEFEVVQNVNTKNVEPAAGAQADDDDGEFQVKRTQSKQ